MTKIHLLLQIFDFDNDEHLTRPELLLLLRSTVTGVRKLCGFPPLSINIFEQLVSHAFATSSSSSSIHKKAGLSYIDFSSWVRMNEDVKCFIAAVSPAAIHSAQKKQQERQHRRASRKPSVHNAMYHNINYSLQNQKGDNAAEMTPKKQHRLHIAAMLHKKHCLEHLKACQELREMYNAMDTQQINRVTLGDFTGSLPNTLKPMAGDMFRSMCSGKYLHFEQLLHEIYPHMTHNEIGMLCSASKKKKNRGTRRPPPVKLSAEQTEEMYAIFDMYNSDHSGNMSVAELTAAMTATGVFTKEECKNYFDLADHHNHHVLNKNDFVHFFQSSFIAEEMAPIFVAHPDDFTPLNSIPHEHNHILL
jgi:Ca2+-binding EF-hand superfamily protein